MELGLSGLASNFDWRTLVDKLTEVERLPQNRLLVEQSGLQSRKNAYGSIQTQLGVLRNRVTTLNNAKIFDSRLAQVADSTIATVTADAGAALGTYSFNFTQLATAAVQQGTADAGKALNATNDVSALVLSSAGFAANVTAGTFTVNGKTITIATSDTLQAVFNQISSATTGAVTASYDAATDKITLSSASAIVLGSATDTSNFLSLAKLYNNGTGTVASASKLGSVKLTGVLSSANLATTISDGGGGAGVFKINGVSISFSASADSMSNVLQRINDSTAGVTATYDAVNDRFLLTNKSTGDMGISLQDVTGNFLAATQLSGSALQRGKNLLYTINGGGQLVSQSNTLTEASSGLTGLSVTALKQASTTVTVSSDTAKIKTAINDFLSEYNKTQTLINTQTASSTDAKGKVTAGILANDSDAGEIATRLRSTVYSEATGLAGTLKHLAGLGIDSNGNDDTLLLADSAKLDAALAANLSGVKDLFTNATAGIAVKLDAYLESAIGEKGTLVTKQSNLTTQASAIDTQISDLERVVQSNRERMIASFISMEKAQAQINQQLQFLQQRLGLRSTSA
ncbi:MAG: flagellar filament capping protein FliD [Verrucomicrobiota bacterium]